MSGAKDRAGLAARVLLAASIVLSPAGARAEQLPYFRYGHLGSYPSDTNLPPVVAPSDYVPGNGDLTLLAPVQVRARPGVPFNLQILAQNADGAVSYASAGSPLPDGLALDSATGVISGLPTGSVQPGQTTSGGGTGTSAGTSTGSGGTTTSSYLMTWDGGLAASAAPVGAGARSGWGEPAELILAQAAGTAPSLDVTPGTQSATDVRIRAQDAKGRSGTTRPFVIDVVPLPVVSLSAPSAQLQAGKPIDLVPTASNLYGSVTWRLAAGKLPIGAYVLPATGAIAGSPEQRGDFSGIVLEVTDADGATGRSAPISISVTSNLSIDGLRDTYVARSGRAIPAIRPYATGATGPVSWSLAAGSAPLPAGLSIDPYTGTLSGVPTTNGTYDGISLRVTDLNSGSLVASDPFTIRVGNVPTIATPADVAVRLKGKSVSVTPAATDILGTPYWTLDGTPPAGVYFDGANGSLRGQPTASGRIDGLTYSVIDMFDGAQATSGSFSILVWPELGVGIPELPLAKVGVPFRSAPVPVWGQWGNVSVTLSGGLPDGLAYDPKTTTIVGTPTKSMLTNYLGLTAVDDKDGAVAYTPLFQINVLPADAVVPFGIDGVSATYRTIIATPFAMRPSVHGSKGAVTFSLAGTPPAWASFDPATGSLAGTPDALGTTAGLSISATDIDGSVVTSVAFSITVDRIGPLALQPPGYAPVLDKPYVSPPPIVTGALGSVTLALAGTPPAGLAFQPSDGTFRGTPTVAGDFPGLVISAVDATGAKASTGPFTIAVTGPDAPQARMAKILAKIGTPFASQPGATGLAPPLTWTLASGTLPAWASLDPRAGTVSGTAPGPVLVDGLALLATGADGKGAQTNAFSIAAAPDPVLSASIGSGFDGKVGVPFYAAAAASGAQGPVGWTLTDGTLPPGVGLQSTTGAMTGTPTYPGIYRGLSLRADDGFGAPAAAGPFVIRIARPDLYAYPPGGQLLVHAGQPLATGAAWTKGLVGQATWSAAGTPLPGISLDPATGILSGTPPSAGSATLTLTATDSYDGATAVAAPVTVTALGPPAASMPPLTTMRRLMPASLAPSASNAIGTPAWRIAAGTLPPGLTFDPGTGKIGGAPTATGRTDGLVLSMVDGTGASASTQPFSIEVDSGIDASIAPASYVARLGVPFTTATPGTVRAAAPVAWDLSAGTLPPWAKLAQDGTISGTPDAVSTSVVTLRATDALGYVATVGPVTIQATDRPIVSMADQVVRQYGVYGFAPTVTGAKGYVTWGFQGSLPPGMSFDPLPTASHRPLSLGTYGGTFSALDADGASGVSPPFSVTVVPGIQVGTVPVVTGRLGFPISVPAPAVTNALGGVTATYLGLPPGIVGTPTTISGTPTEFGTFSASEKVVDGKDLSYADTTVGFQIARPMAVVGSPPDVPIHPGQAASTVAPSVVGQRGPTLAWSISVGTPPPGSVLDPATGILSIPAQEDTGTYPGIVLQVTDPVDGASATTAPFRIDVLPSPAVVSVPTYYLARLGGALTTALPRMIDAAGATTWSWGAGSAPPPWAKVVPATGSLSGTPTALGEYPGLTLTGTDSTGVSATSVPFTLKVFKQPSVTLSSATPAYRLRVGQPFSLSATADGIAGTPSWSLQVVSGALPPGLTFDPATGTVQGTVLGAGNVAFSIAAIDSVDGTAGLSQAVSITAMPALVLSGTQPLYSARMGTYLATDPLSIVGAQGGISLAISPSPPGGTTFNANGDGVTKGIPGAPYPLTTMTVTATDDWDGATAKDTYQLQVLGAMTASGTAPVNVHAGQDVAQAAFTPSTAYATGTATVAWSLASGALPPGLAVAPASGRLVGAPTGTYASTKAYTATLLARDIDGQSARTQSFAVTVYPPLTISAGAASASARTDLRATVPAPTVGNLIGKAGFSLRTVSGTAPPDAAVGGDGSVSFTPAAAGTWAFTVTATDVDGASVTSGSTVVTITDPPRISMPVPATVYSTASLPLKATVTRAVGAVTYSYSSNVPWWISLPSASDGSFTLYTPGIAPGSYGPYTVSVKDSTGAVGSTTFGFTVVPNTLAVSAPASNQSVTWHAGQASTFQAAATGASTATAFAFPAAAPAWMTLGGNGLLVANPTAAQGASSVRLRVTEPATGQWAEAVLGYTVVAPMTLALDQSTAWSSVGQSMYPVKSTVGNAVGAVTWSLSGAPAGVTIDPGTGTVSGTPGPGTGGNYTVTVTASDTAAGTVSRSFQLGVNPNGIAAGYVVFTTPGSATFTPLLPAQRIRVLVVGGGANGSANSNSAGGGSGIVAAGAYTVTGPVAVTVGAGGPGSSGDVNGGASSFGAFVSAAGGTKSGGGSGGGGRWGYYSCYGGYNGGQAGMNGNNGSWMSSPFSQYNAPGGGQGNSFAAALATMTIAPVGAGGGGGAQIGCNNSGSTWAVAGTGGGGGVNVGSGTGNAKWGTGSYAGAPGGGYGAGGGGAPNGGSNGRGSDGIVVVEWSAQ